MTEESRVNAGDTLEQVEIVIVSYRSRPLIEELVNSWPNDLAVAVVDNSHNVDGITELVNGRRQLRCLDGGGQGFARAANLGAFTSQRPRVIFVNPDSRPALADLEALVEGLDRDPRAVSHAPVTATDGVIEMGVGGWEPSVGRTAIHATGLHLLWPQAGLFAKPKLGEAQQVDWTTGDCMAVRTDQFRALGGFDETYYLYAEDMSFGRRAREAGLRTVLREDVVIPHVAATSGAPALEMLQVRGASFTRYLTLHNSAVRGQIMRLLLAVGYLARIAQRRLMGRGDEARLFWAFIRGLMTGRAEVDGVEVALARYLEMARHRSEL